MKDYTNTYLFKLIDRATSSNLFENNQIGNYKISPQHGINELYIYNIYKNNNHISTITIDGLLKSIEAQVVKDLSIKEIETINDFIFKFYSDFNKIQITNF